MQLEPYLFFPGTCEEALNFYAGIFGGTAEIKRFEGSPMAEEVPPHERNRVMHASFVSPTIRFMGSDGMNDDGCEVGNISLALGLSDRGEANRIFGALAAGGEVSMPIAEQFWGAYFGSCVDRYNIPWMINCS